MFESLVILSHKFLRADDARIRKIARTISESIASTEFKIFAALLFKNLILDELDAAFLWPVHRSSFIDISSIPTDALFSAFDVEFFQAEVSGEKLAPVVGLYMIPK